MQNKGREGEEEEATGVRMRKSYEITEKTMKKKQPQIKLDKTPELVDIIFVLFFFCLF